MIQINLINTWENDKGEKMNLPEVWGSYHESVINKIVLLHSRTEIMGQKAPPQHVWVKSYTMNPPDDSWKMIGTRHG